jgi:two-component system sensor histidine kinase KdpD
MTATERGKLKIFLGFAAGVGKTYQMLEEGQELRRNGVDVVVGYFEPHGRKDTIAQIEGLETIPRRTMEYRGTAFEEMDTDAVLRRHPAVCLVDEFPHTNVPGSERDKRWEDVLAMLNAGISVYTTMNIQHLESLNDQVLRISGVKVRETIPDWVMEQASEVVMVDLTPRALLNRLERGVVYSQEKAQKALDHFFRESTLVALREMALRQTAHEVGSRQTEDVHDRAVANGTSEENRPAGLQERIMVLVTADPSSVALIRRAKRVADFISAECIAVAVAKAGPRTEVKDGSVERHLNFARNLHVDARLVEGASVPETLVQFARNNGITQIFLNWPKRMKWLPPFVRNDVQKLVSLAKDMQLTIVDERLKVAEPAR